MLSPEAGIVLGGELCSLVTADVPLLWKVITGMIARDAACGLFTGTVLPWDLTGAATQPMEHVEMSHAL